MRVTTEDAGAAGVAALAGAGGAAAPEAAGLTAGWPSAGGSACSVVVCVVTIR
jgi:hypothetical protein